jgi:AmmeMemoRadiSam system protein A
MEFNITADEKRFLLAEAKESIRSELEKRKPSYPKDSIDENSALLKPCGAFVSLHKTDQGVRKLRGCIGRITASLSLQETVRIMAKEAAFYDSRFPPIKQDEFDQCHIEISAISPMIPCTDPMLVKIGTHGLYLKKGGQSGLLLPQVPVEQKWNLGEYLNYICLKAGLPSGSYNAPDAQLFTFTAVIFSESPAVYTKSE